MSEANAKPLQQVMAVLSREHAEFLYQELKVDKRVFSVMLVRKPYGYFMNFEMAHGEKFKFFVLVPPNQPELN